MDAREVVEAYASAWERGDPQAAWGFYADDVVMRLPGRGSLAGLHRGREAVISCIQGLLDRTGDASADVEVIDRLLSPTHVALIVREAVSRGDDRLELRRVNVYRVHEDKIVEITIYEADQYEVDEFFG